MMAALLTFFVLLLALILVPSNAQRNITVGSFLTTQDVNTPWLSPSGDFAFGFQLVDANNSYFLAVWFDKTVDKTVAWYAKTNTEVPQLVVVPSGSRVQLSSDDGLSLRDPAGHELWNPQVTSAAYANMLDTGNFVLAGADGSTKWGTFDSPADTILPSQELPNGTKLQARLMDTDYSNGRFILSLETNGNLTFYPAAVPTGFKYEDDAYWSTNTSGRDWKLVYDVNGTIYYTSENSMQRTIIMPAEIDSIEFVYHRATLDPDGVLRQYKYPKKEAVSSGLPARWTVVQSVPTNICSIIYSDFGSGVCGYNSYCLFNWNQTQTDCACAPRYKFFDQERKYKGCKPDFALQSCDFSEAEILEQFEMIPMTDIDWPHRAYEQYGPINESTCQNLCLTDCFCAAAVFDHQTEHCWKKKLPLSNGREGSDVPRMVFLKVPKNNNAQPQLNTEANSKWKTTRKDLILGGSILLGSSAFVNLLFISGQFLRTCRRIVRKKKITSQPWSRVITRAFSYKELEEATNGFSEEVGRGASGVVYKGCLQDEFGTCIAVKKIDRIPRETEKEFTMEVETIGHTLHKNLIQLLGYCYEGTERLLVYPFMGNGSLTKFLFSGMRPPWDLRVDIAHGVARGLLYLHEECGKQIIHCDIKPENILLADNFAAKISDFGLAKLLKTEQTQTSTGIRGTRGYFAPEWFKNVGISSKVDVYSFGIVLLEIVCCRRNVDLKAADEDQVILTYWAYDCYRCGRLGLLVEGDEDAMINMKMVERFMTVALWCIQDEPAMRPTMLKVIKMLDGAIDAPQPPLDIPSFVSSLL